MAQVTIRRVKEAWIAEAKRKAQLRGESMNQVLVDALQSGLGLAGEDKTNGLEQFSGSIPDNSEAETEYWARFLSDDLNQVNPDDWK